MRVVQASLFLNRFKSDFRAYSWDVHHSHYTSSSVL